MRCCLLPFDAFKIYSSTHLFYNLFRSCKPYSCAFNFSPFPYLVASEKSCFSEEKLKKISIFNQQSVENEFLTTSKKETIKKAFRSFRIDQSKLQWIRRNVDQLFLASA